MSDSIWFPHDVNAKEDKKITLLLKRHGWLGYGIYWSLIEKLHLNQNRLGRDYDTLAFAMQEQCDRIKSIIEDFKLFRLNKQSFSSDRVKKNLREREDKRRKAKESADKRWNNANV